MHLSHNTSTIMCGVLVFTNLVLPEVKHVPCHKPFLLHVICLVEKTNLFEKGVRQTFPQLDVFDPDCVVLNGTCYLFVLSVFDCQSWFLHKQGFFASGSLDMFHFLFDAVAVKVSPLIMSGTVKKYQRFSYVYVFEDVVLESECGRLSHYVTSKKDKRRAWQPFPL